MAELSPLIIALKCCAAHIYTTPPDALGKIFCYLQCNICKEKNFCLHIKRQVEEELNRREQAKPKQESLWDHLELERRLGK